MAGWNRVGAQTAFYAKTIAEMRTAFGHYRREIVRLVAQMSLGTGALAVIGGTVVIVGFLTLSTGAVIAVQGYNQLSGIGVEAMTGFVSAYVNVRHHCAGGSRRRPGRHYRRGCHRATGCDADQLTRSTRWR